MAVRDFIGRTVRSLSIVAALVGVATLAAPRPAEALGTGAAIGLGVGSFALGTAVGAAANPYAYPYGYYPPAPAYYPPPPAYYPPARSCWDPYYRRYYAC